MKKILVLFLVLAFWGLVSSNSYAASTPKKGVVKTNKSNLLLRTGPSTKYSIVGRLPKGTSIDITGVSGAWYKVIANGTNGYVYSSYVTVTEYEDSNVSNLPKNDRIKIGRDLGKSASGVSLGNKVAE